MGLGAQAQVLARPGWAGSGISIETWWRGAVFYRIVPESFQDSDGDGKGDLRGVSQRMGYLQTLGVDAIVLETPFIETGFDEVVSEASRRHIRVLVSLPASDAQAVPKARHWLLAGAAGVWLRFSKDDAVTRVNSLVHDVRALANSIPGDRIVVEDTTADPGVVPAPGAQLVAYALPSASSTLNAGTIRAALNQAQHVPKGSDALLLEANGSGAGNASAAQTTLQQQVLAMAMLVSREAVALYYGQEIGVRSSLSAKPIMRWTPANVTKPAPADVDRPAKPPARRPENEYGSYVPYVAPKPQKPVKLDLNELPGFTSGTLPKAGAGESAVEDVATQDEDKNSLLNLFRRFSQLHRSDPAVRSGVSYPLDLEEQNVLLWVMRAPAGARTGAALFAGANLSDKLVAFSLHEDVVKMKLRGGPLRVIFTTKPANIQADQITDATVIAAQSMMLAYLDR